jgi:hypothetical protein
MTNKREAGCVAFRTRIEMAPNISDLLVQGTLTLSHGVTVVAACDRRVFRVSFSVYATN